MRPYCARGDGEPGLLSCKRKTKRLSWGSWERRSTRKGKNLLKLVSCQHESMQKLDRIGSLTNGERNFWASFPADLAETKGALTCAMICLPELYADAATRDWIWWSVKIPLVGTAWNPGPRCSEMSNFPQDNPKNFITVQNTAKKWEATLQSTAPNKPHRWYQPQQLGQRLSFTREHL